MTSAANTTRRTESHSNRWLFFFLGACFLALLTGCGQRDELLQLSGQTMGTSWNVSIVPTGDAPGQDDLLAGIESILEQINASMSTYRADSEISRFNALPTGQWFALSPEFYAVLSTAMAVGFQSHGAYDVTVGPLVDLWGFGPQGLVDEPPADDTVTDVLERVGLDHLRLDGESQQLLKRSPVELDFSSIAKGYAVDAIARWLTAQGQDRYLVEVGGEMRLSGLSARGDPWRIAIERPDSGGREVLQAVRLTDVAVATSGDYRNYFELDGQRYSHSIDPRRGYPVAHDLVSVTVIDNSAALADAWATALIVMGYEEGMAVALEQGLAVYFIQRRGDTLHSSHTPGFARFLEPSGASN